MSQMFATTETFREVADLLFGGGADELVSKMNPEGTDLCAPAGPAVRGKIRAKKRTKVVAKSAPVSDKPKSKKAYHAALAGNALATVGGAHALAMSLGGEKVPGSKQTRKIAGKLKSLPGTSHARRGLKMAGEAVEKNPKVAAGVAASWVGLHAAELGSDVYANRAIRENYHSNKKPVHKCLTPVNKSIQEIKEQASNLPRSKRDLTVAAVTSAGHAAGKGTEYALKNKGKLRSLPERLGRHKRKEVSKSADLDIVWEGEFSKVNADKQQVFGWASIVELNGEPVVDLQGDYISIDEVEKSGYDYVKKSRKGGDMHLRDGDQPVHASDMIESFIVTPEKKQALGLPDDMPVGWWCGFQINDPVVWEKVKSGERNAFSIHGIGKRSDGFI